jgi:hypothetical protein
MPKRLRSLLSVALLMAGWSLYAGQNPEPQSPRPQMHKFSGERAFGTITSVGIDRFVIKKMDGTEQTVMINDKTRYSQGQQEIQLEDLKTGDRVLVRGSEDANKMFVAQMVRIVTDEEMQRFQSGGARTFGEITSIEKGQLKVRNPRQGERIVTLNDQTSFIKDGNPATLEDLKVGERVFVLGKEDEGKFTATRVVINPTRGRRPFPEGPGPQ